MSQPKRKWRNEYRVYKLWSSINVSRSSQCILVPRVECIGYYSPTDNNVVLTEEKTENTIFLYTAQRNAQSIQNLSWKACSDSLASISRDALFLRLAMHSPSAFSQRPFQTEGVQGQQIFGIIPFHILFAFYSQEGFQ